MNISLRARNALFETLPSFQLSQNYFPVAVKGDLVRGNIFFSFRKTDDKYVFDRHAFCKGAIFTSDDSVCGKQTLNTFFLGDALFERAPFSRWAIQFLGKQTINTFFLIGTLFERGSFSRWAIQFGETDAKYLLLIGALFERAPFSRWVIQFVETDAKYFLFD